ncbi:MAG: hypothetical protein ABI947_05635 [Chloroflexota bacterium]
MQSWRTLTPVIIIVTSLMVMLVAILIGWSEVALLMGVAGTIMLLLQRRLLAFMLLLVVPAFLIVRQVQAQLTFNAVPAPRWSSSADDTRFVKCENIFPPVPTLPATESTASPAIPAERGKFLVDTMLAQALQHDSSLNEQDVMLAQDRVTKLRLISAAFPDGQTHLAWYRSVVISRYPRADLTIAYADAASGEPLMIVTDVRALWEAGLECRDGAGFSPEVAITSIQLGRQLAANYLLLLIFGNVVVLIGSYIIARRTQNNAKRQPEKDSHDI